MIWLLLLVLGGCATDVPRPIALPSVGTNVRMLPTPEAVDRVVLPWGADETWFYRLDGTSVYVQLADSVVACVRIGTPCAPLPKPAVMRTY